MLICFSAVSMWIMARRQDAARWTRWPALVRVSSCKPTLSIASGGSRSCTAPTVTMTSHQSPCQETPPSPVTCEQKQYRCRWYHVLGWFSDWALFITSFYSSFQNKNPVYKQQEISGLSSSKHYSEHYCTRVNNEVNKYTPGCK